MPNTRSAAKRMRADHKRRSRNLSAASELKTLTKQFNALVAAQQVVKAQELLRLLTGKLDKAGHRGVIHPNTAARKKAALSRHLSRVPGTAPAAA